MKHIVIGFIAIIAGLYGIAVNWYQVVDLFWVLVPLALLFGGIVALLAGINNFSKTSVSEIEVKTNERSPGGINE